MENLSNHRIGVNESLYRDVNEGIERGIWPGEEDRRVPFRCECARLECTDTVALTPVQYERVRANPRRFLVLAGHEAAGAERVVECHPGYVVVEKVGEAAVVAEDRDPRS